jgi:alanyl-tRNA synthetase
MVLGPEVKQGGSDITAERMRFDFAFPRKVTPEEIKKVEDIVNGVVAKDLPVSYQEMSKDDAMKTGALYFFKEKYPEKVKVYYVGHSIPDAFSKEFCGGPHVDHTAIIGKFKITKEESVGAGMRRLRAIVD